MTEKTVSVFGAGSWGTALAIQLARQGNDVRLWARDPAMVEAMQSERRNQRYLPNIRFPDNLIPVQDISDLQSADYWLVAVPSEAFGALLKRLKSPTSGPPPLIWATKGFENTTGRLLHHVVHDAFGEDYPYGIVSGPTFAGEVAQGLPTAMTLAAKGRELQAELADLFHGGGVRIYTSDDVIGVELGGAVKNVLAIAAGISDGLGFGANARAALITRGLAEIMRLGDRLGAKSETLMGLTGLGDLVLTCTDDQSRNRRYGLALGQGRDLQQAKDEIGQVVEGAATAGVIMRVAQQADVEMPICNVIYKILYKGLTPKAAVEALFSRSLKSEY
jgi:glycerol-3-phosphate dehydrogenase (NAD(P)+)